MRRSGAPRPLLIVGPHEEVTSDDVGAKAFHLQELVRQGIPVPPWIAISARVLEIVLGPAWERVQTTVGELPEGDAAAVASAASQIAALIEEAAWPGWLRDELARSVAGLSGRHRLAVRSSAVGEDGSTRSFAGQLASFLFVRSERVEEAVRRCWAAAFSEKAVRYRQLHGLTRAPLRVGVVIQEMVDARVSGVAFSADPVTGVAAHVVVAGWGVACGTGDDAVESDTFVRDFGARSWRSTIRHKTRRAAPRPDGLPGTDLVTVPAEERDRPTLTAAELDTISALLRGIEARAGRAQDVEWAIDQDGRLWLLQARPITAQPGGDLQVWDDSNICENYPGLTLPLTGSYVRFVYERLFGRALRLAGLSRAAVEHVRPALRHLVGLIRGRLYFNLTSYYRLFGVVPGVAGTVRHWETALGIAQPGEITSQSLRSAAGRLWFRLLGIRTALCLVARFVRLGHDGRVLESRVALMRRQYGLPTCAGRSFEDLWTTYRGMSDRFLDGWVLLIFNDFFAFMLGARLAKLSARAGMDLHNRLLAGLTGVASMTPVGAMLRLVERARREPALTALLQSDRSAKEVWAELRRNGSYDGFRQAVDAYLQDYGERMVAELKFESRPPSDTPWTSVSLLRAQLDSEPPSPAAPGGNSARDEAAVREFRQLFGRNIVARGYGMWVLRQARRCVTQRENLSYARCQAYGVLRNLFLEMGKALARVGSLREPTDVFYLTLEDLEAYYGGSLPEAELTSLVGAREAGYAQFAQESLPRRFVCRGSPYALGAPRSEAVPPASEGRADSFSGVACSPGVAQGPARVLRSPTLLEKVEGQILVAPVTDPGWALLIARAKGLVVERGSILSHAAIIARELGIPSVVGVEGATTLLSSGDEIEVNGSSGVIRVLRRARQ